MLAKSVLSGKQSCCADYAHPAYLIEVTTQLDRRHPKEEPKTE